MQIRKAKLSDLAGIAGILNESIVNDTARFDVLPKTDDEIIDFFNQHDDRFPLFVAVIDGAVAGWGSISPYSSKICFRFSVEDSVYVHKDYRGQGIGVKILKTLIETAKGLGYHTIVGLITSTNISSVRLHAKCGFECVGRLKQIGNKFDTWLDVDSMQMML